MRLLRTAGLLALLLVLSSSVTEGASDQGSLQKRQGVWVLHLAGTPEEMGTQAGTLLKPQVQALVGRYVPGMLKLTGGNREDVLETARKLEPGIPAGYVTEMKTLAKAAEVPYEDLLMANLSVELFGSSLCSCAVVGPEACTEKETLFGRNLDWFDDGTLARSAILVAAFPKDATPFLSVSYPGLVGVMTGVNARGLAVANMVVHHPGLQPKGIPYPFLQRRLLETCGNREEARKAVEAASRTVSQNLALADREGGCFLETNIKDVRMRPDIEGMTGGTNSFGEDKDPARAGKRYQVLCACCAKKPVSADTLLKGLREAAIPTMNVQCCLFRLGSMKATLSYSTLPASKGPFVDVDLAELLKP